MTLTSFVEHKKYIKLAPKQYEVWKNVILKYEQYSYPDDLEMVKNKIVDNLEPKFCPPKFRKINENNPLFGHCLLYTSPSPRDAHESRMPSSA